MAGSGRLTFVGPVWILSQGSGQKVIRNPVCGYFDVCGWGSLACTDYSFGGNRINDTKETVQVSFS